MVLCKAWGCSVKCRHSVTLHYFPTNDPALYRVWVVKVNREDFKLKDVNKHCRLCAWSFVDDDDEVSPANIALFKATSGLKIQPWHNKFVVPSVFAHRPAKERRSKALMKKRHFVFKILRKHGDIFCYWNPYSPGYQMICHYITH